MLGREVALAAASVTGVCAQSTLLLLFLAGVLLLLLGSLLLGAFAKLANKPECLLLRCLVMFPVPSIFPALVYEGEMRHLWSGVVDSL